MKPKEASIYRSEHFHSAGSVQFLTGVDIIICNYIVFSMRLIVRIPHIAHIYHDLIKWTINERSVASVIRK